MDFIESLPEHVKEYRTIFNAVLSKILSKESAISNVKFNLAQIFEAPKPTEEDDEDAAKNDEAKPANNNPLALCVFLPEPIPEENEEEVGEPTKEPEQDNPENDNQDG